ERVDLSIAMKSSVGFGDLFSAGDNNKIHSILDNAQKHLKLTIQFVQQGGKIGDLPVDLMSSANKIKSLAREALDAGKPTYIVVYPYSELPGLARKERSAEGNLLQLALRYYKRLTSLHAEILAIEEDYRKDRTVTPLPNDAYFFEYKHRLR